MCYGISNILVYGSIFNGPRNKINQWAADVDSIFQDFWMSHEMFDVNTKAFAIVLFVIGIIVALTYIPKLIRNSIRVLFFLPR